LAKAKIYSMSDERREVAASSLESTDLPTDQVSKQVGHDIYIRCQNRREKPQRR